MSKLISLALGLSLFIAPTFAFAQTSHDSRGTNVNIDGTIWYITLNNCKSAYTSAGAFLSYGFKFNDVASATEFDRSLPVCQQNEFEADHVYGFGSFIPPQRGKIVCSDRGTDKGTCYVTWSTNIKYGFTSAEIFFAQGYSFSNTVSADISWIILDT